MCGRVSGLRFLYRTVCLAVRVLVSELYFAFIVIVSLARVAMFRMLPLAIREREATAISKITHDSATNFKI